MLASGDEASEKFSVVSLPCALADGVRTNTNDESGIQKRLIFHFSRILVGRLLLADATDLDIDRQDRADLCEWREERLFEAVDRWHKVRLLRRRSV